MNRDIKPPIILVVEDEEDIRRLIVEVLRLKGYEVLEAGDAATAFVLFTQCDVTIFIADLELRGGENGLSLMQRANLWATEAGRVFLSIAVTAFDHLGAEPIENATVLEFDYVLRKPFEAEQLLNIIREEISI